MTDLRSGIQAEKRPASMTTLPLTVAEAIAGALRELGAVHACGVSGGAQALLWAALSKHLEVLHFRHEGGAAFAAPEAYFTRGRPVVVLTPTSCRPTPPRRIADAAASRRRAATRCPPARFSKQGLGSTTPPSWKRPTNCRRSCGGWLQACAGPAATSRT